MFQSILISLVLISPFSANAAPQKEAVEFKSIYAPAGFDSNDNVQIVGEGKFSSTCYRPAETQVSIDHTKKEIHLSPVAYKYSGFCLQVVLPFERVIDLGLLKPGTYAVFSNSNKLGDVTVKRARSAAPDDFPYAPISQAFFKQTGLISQVLVAGEFPSDCMSLEKVDTTVEAKVLVLQPVMKVESRPTCKEGRFPFFEIVTIDLVPAGRYLLHVRSMNGKAINSLIEVN